jgi:hypothetical protein
MVATSAAAAASAAAGGDAQLPQLSYWEKTPPFAAVAMAGAAGVQLPHGADPKATNKTITKLQFPGG